MLFAAARYPFQEAEGNAWDFALFAEADDTALIKIVQNQITFHKTTIL